MRREDLCSKGQRRNCKRQNGKGQQMNGQCSTPLSLFQFVTEFRSILLGVKSDDSAAKRLTSQFIVRFFPKFPDLSSEALDAILDLCEDEDVAIRKQAIKVHHREEERGFALVYKSSFILYPPRICLPFVANPRSIFPRSPTSSVN